MTQIKTDPGKPSKAELARWRKLVMSKYRRREGLFLAEGCKVVAELLKSRWQIESLLSMEGKETQKAGRSESKSEVPRYILSGKEWETLSQDQAPEGLMAVVKMPAPMNDRTCPACRRHQQPQQPGGDHEDSALVRLYHGAP
jgi:tRNA G18 (ribose-2'-O)-methylase SpoU